MIKMKSKSKRPALIPFVCPLDQCLLTYKYRCNLKRHIRKCHVPNGCRCPHCPCTFETDAERDSHIRVHGKLCSGGSESSSLNDGTKPESKKLNATSKSSKKKAATNINNEISSSGEVFYCLEAGCTRIFPSDWGRNIHYQRSHLMSKQKKKKDQNEETPIVLSATSSSSSSASSSSSSLASSFAQRCVEALCNSSTKENDSPNIVKLVFLPKRLKSIKHQFTSLVSIGTGKNLVYQVPEPPSDIEEEAPTTIVKNVSLKVKKSKRNKKNNNTKVGETSVDTEIETVVTPATTTATLNNISNEVPILQECEDISSSKNDALIALTNTTTTATTTDEEDKLVSNNDESQDSIVSDNGNSNVEEEEEEETVEAEEDTESPTVTENENIENTPEPEEKQDDEDENCDANSTNKDDEDDDADYDYELDAEGNELFATKRGSKPKIWRPMKQKRKANHQCPVCKERFTCKTTLRLHIAEHPGQKPWPCDECWLAYRHQPEIYQHKRWHHVPNGKFRCTFCPCSFDKETVYKRHMTLEKIRQAGGDPQAVRLFKKVAIKKVKKAKEPKPPKTKKQREPKTLKVLKERKKQKGPKLPKEPKKPKEPKDQVVGDKKPRKKRESKSSKVQMEMEPVQPVEPVEKKKRGRKRKIKNPQDEEDYVPPNMPKIEMPRDESGVVVRRTSRKRIRKILEF